MTMTAPLSTPDDQQVLARVLRVDLRGQLGTSFASISSLVMSTDLRSVPMSFASTDTSA